MRYRLIIGLWLCSLSSWAITFSEEAKRYNQVADSINHTLTLVFCIDSAHYAIPLDSIKAVYAWGSMSDYKDAMASCKMTDFSEDSCFYKTFTYDQIARPGDSGQPEFEFYTELIGDSTVYYTPDMMRCPYDERIMFHNGITPVLIVLPDGPNYMTTDWDELADRAEEAKIIKPLSEYDLDDLTNQHRISNFRRVPATNQLYRSYHPYYPSNPKRDTEYERLNWVQNLATQAGIKSVISLNYNMASTAGQTYVCAGDTHVITIPTYYQTIMDNKDIIYINASSSQCYYYPDEMKFAQYMQQVVEFIIDDTHPLPMQIHCAIGADRTGVVCAVIAALCGADWETIVADYTETSQMKAQTYRHQNRIYYAMQHLTGLKDPSQATPQQIAQAIRNHLVQTMGVLTNQQIDNMVQRLTQPLPTSLGEPNLPSSVERSLDLLGRSIPVNSVGFQIRIDEQGKCTKSIVMP